jgi:hypothetical protein
MWRHRRNRIALAGAMCAAAAATAWLFLARHEPTPPLVDDLEAASSASSTDTKLVVTDEVRANLLRRAQVWKPPAVPIARARFDGINLDELSCKFKVGDLGGTSPKFDCTLESGEEVRIKYGNGPEVPAEAAATRLLGALGFGADHITLLRKLRCFGCPDEPFSTLKAVEITRTEPLFKHVVDYTDYEEFHWVAIERKFEARPIETTQVEGWAFFELDQIDAKAGGAPRAHIDALRLIAVLLAHWDNKPENQRLVCLSDSDEHATCTQPFLLLQDVGATFGPAKMDLPAWEQAPIWEDRATCFVSMRTLPFNGATFGRATITEAGRKFLGERLNLLSDDQLVALFESARFAEKRGVFSAPHQVADWVRVFRAKTHAITDGPACPAA